MTEEAGEQGEKILDSPARTGFKRIHLWMGFPPCSPPPAKVPLPDRKGGVTPPLQCVMCLFALGVAPVLKRRLGYGHIF